MSFDHSLATSYERESSFEQIILIASRNSLHYMVIICTRTRNPNLVTQRLVLPDGQSLKIDGDNYTVVATLLV